MWKHMLKFPNLIASGRAPCRMLHGDVYALDEPSDKASFLAIAWDQKIQVDKLLKSELKALGKWTLESAAISLAWSGDHGHWVLFPIDLVSHVVYYLYPMRHSPDENMKQIVNQGIRIYQSLKCDRNNFKGIDNYSMKDLSELCDRWATYVAKLITAYNRELEKLEVVEHVDSEG
ncbi:hypothetical protein OROMI_001454 [Orobanche minor]